MTSGVVNHRYTDLGVRTEVSVPTSPGYSSSQADTRGRTGHANAVTHIPSKWRTSSSVSCHQTARLARQSVFGAFNPAHFSSHTNIATVPFSCESSVYAFDAPEQRLFEDDCGLRGDHGVSSSHSAIARHVFPHNASDTEHTLSKPSNLGRYSTFTTFVACQVLWVQSS